MSEEKKKIILPPGLEPPGSSEGLITPYNFNILPAPDQEDVDIREAMRKVRDKWKREDPDYRKKQLDGVIAPKPIISPEHYHLSYEYQDHTFPDMTTMFRRARFAYLEMWRKMSLSVVFGEPEFNEGDGTITISTPLKGRTGIHRIRMRAVACILLECGRLSSPLQPLVDPKGGDIRE